MIALITDFGIDDIYVGIMKAAISEHAPNVPIVDITHSIPAHNVGAGSFALACAVPYLPVGTVIVAVVDPGVGTGRSRLAASVDGRIVLAPDNGLLTDLSWRYKDAMVVRIDADRFVHGPVSATFEGRDIFGPVAAALATGTGIGEAGQVIHGGFSETQGKGILPRPVSSGNAAIGHLRHIDRFGNILTDLRPGILVPSDKYQVSFEGVKTLTVPFVRTYGEVEVGRLCLLTGSFGYIELACRNASAAGLFPDLRYQAAISIKAVAE